MEALLWQPTGRQHALRRTQTAGANTAVERF